MYDNLPYLEQKWAIVKDINHFVNHSDQVYKHSIARACSTARILDKINLVKNRVIEINTYFDLYTICIRVWHLKKALYEILPHPLNNSYNNSLADLVEIIRFCNDYIINSNSNEAKKNYLLTLRQKLKKLQTT